MQQQTAIPTDSSGRELTVFGTPMFPLRVFGEDPREFDIGYVEWHWHPECEVSVVMRGAIEVECAGESIKLEVGEGVFINTDQLHAIRPVGDAASWINTVVFSADVVSGASYSTFHTKYVLPVIRNAQLHAVTLRRTSPRNCKALDGLATVIDIYEAEEFGYELDLRNILCDVWACVARECNTKVATSFVQGAYLKDLLTFIWEHYAEELTLADIAASAGVSVRTCSRAFKEQLNTTTFRYLMEYRVWQAAKMLTETDKTIVDICYDCGFSDPSYFAKTFRSITGSTPVVYRKNAANGIKGEVSSTAP